MKTFYLGHAFFVIYIQLEHLQFLFDILCKDCKIDNVITFHLCRPEVFCKKRCFQKFCKIRRKTPVPESLFNKVAGRSLNECFCIYYCALFQNCAPFCLSSTQQHQCTYMIFHKQRFFFDSASALLNISMDSASDVAQVLLIAHHNRHHTETINVLLNRIEQML